MNEQRFDPDWAVDLDFSRDEEFQAQIVRASEPTPADFALARFIKRRRRKLGQNGYVGATGAMPKGGKRKRSRR